jgi:hypothetical protein
MYNHARTLLLNLSAPARPGLGAVTDVPGDEATPPGYVQLNLPTYLQQVRGCLFGATPDRTMLCYRARQLLTMLHATELVEYVLRLDPRITYDYGPRSDSVLYTTTAFQPVITQLAGTNQIYFGGTPAEPDLTGQCAYHVSFTMLDATHVEIVRMTPPASFQVFTFTSTATLTSAIPVTGTGYTLQLGPGLSLPAFVVSGYLRPQWELGDIAAALQSVSAASFVQLFGAAPVEPYLTFSNLWLSHPELPYQLGGLVLALLYRTEEVRLTTHTPVTGVLAPWPGVFPAPPSESIGEYSQSLPE